jgi:hypothetical protein
MRSGWILELLVLAACAAVLVGALALLWWG